jgi:hypothetical protein
MAAPLDPVIAEIIPLLRLRDPATMTPQSAHDSLRALAAARAAVPPPPVRHHEGAGLIHGYPGPGEASEVARAEAQRARADFKALLARGV